MSVIKVIKAGPSVVVLFKGDLPGHEFHGNQWSEGMGASGVADVFAKEKDALDDVGDKLTSSTAENLDESGKRGVEAWTAWQSGAINDIARKGKLGSNWSKFSYAVPPEELLADLDHAMEGKVLEKDAMLFRKIDSKAFSRINGPVADIFVDKGFVATTITPETLDKGLAHGRYRVVIDVPKGTPGMYIGRHSSAENNERELLLGRGLTFKRVSVSEEDKTVRLQVVPAIKKKAVENNTQDDSVDDFSKFVWAKDQLELVNI